MAYSLIGKDFTPPDVRAKVTGSAKYPEDFRADESRFLTYPDAARRAIAMGGHTFKRTPVTTDMIVNVLAGREQSHGPLDVNTA